MFQSNTNDSEKALELHNLPWNSRGEGSKVTPWNTPLEEGQRGWVLESGGEEREEDGEVGIESRPSESRCLPRQVMHNETEHKKDQLESIFE